MLPQTSSTYWSEQELVAPVDEGLYKWSASVIASDLQLQHEVNAKQFAFFVTDAPDHIVTVEVVAKSKETPLQNASVFMNRRRASTDEFGRASLEVVKGTHKLYVSIDHYAPFETIVDVDGDVAVRAELVFDPDQYTI